MKYYIFALALLFLACNYSFEPTPEPTRLVVNARMYQDSGLIVQLSRSVAPVGTIDPRQLWVTNGTVTLINDQTQQQIALTNIGNGQYRTANFTPVVGAAYHIEAAAAELPNATSESVIFPSQPLVDSFRFVRDAIYDAQFGNAKFIRNDIFWKEPQAQKNYYALRTIGFTRDSLVVHGLLSFFNQPDITTFCDGVTYFDQFAFSDNCIPNEVQKSKYFINTSLDGFANFSGKELGKIEIELAHVSESFFKYTSTRDQPEGIERAFVEPKINYSNIKNGYGIFVALHTKKFIHIF